jgi:hypothetical protein
MLSIDRAQPFRFRLSDVICPDRDQILKQITSELEVCGEVLFLSDSGDKKGHFAILEVKGIPVPLVVSLDHLIFESSADSTAFERAGLDK